MECKECEVHGSFFLVMIQLRAVQVPSFLDCHCNVFWVFIGTDMVQFVQHHCYQIPSPLPQYIFTLFQRTLTAVSLSVSTYVSIDFGDHGYWESDHLILVHFYKIKISLCPKKISSLHHHPFEQCLASFQVCSVATTDITISFPCDWGSFPIWCTFLNFMSNGLAISFAMSFRTCWCVALFLCICIPICRHKHILSPHHLTQWQTAKDAMFTHQNFVARSPLQLLL